MGSTLAGDKYLHFEFFAPFRSFQVGIAKANGIKHDHSTEAIDVLDPR